MKKKKSSLRYKDPHAPSLKNAEYAASTHRVGLVATFFGAAAGIGVLVAVLNKPTYDGDSPAEAEQMIATDSKDEDGYFRDTLSSSSFFSRKQRDWLQHHGL